LFFLLVRLPTRLTLFPYTTLFRSGLRDRVDSSLVATLVDSREFFGEARADCAATIEKGASASGDFMKYATRHNIPGRKLGIRMLDRKSTRLNSSHVKISYAVYCLK